MTIHHQDANVTLHHGDCLDVLRSLPDASVDSVVTDPPYGLEFMGKSWDGADGFRRSLNPADAGRDNAFGRASRTSPEYRAGALFQEWCEAWAAECLRVLKPGGHLLAFGGTRTWHRLACAVEDAGFEVRDSIAWLYGSGFPKSLDVSKAIDKAAPRVGMPAGFAAHYAERRQAKGLTHHDICRIGGFYANVNHGGASVNWERGHNVPTPEQWDALADILDIPRDMWADLIARAEAEREVTGVQKGAMAGWNMDGTTQFVDRDVTAPATDAAREWVGWGSAMKPAFEPVVVARKPLIGTIAQNVLTHGTGALNIDASRIEHGGNIANADGGGQGAGYEAHNKPTRIYGNGLGGVVAEPHNGGRWPANVILDEDMAGVLDEQSGDVKGSKPGTIYKTPRRPIDILNGGGWHDGVESQKAFGYGDSGGASRFFYVAPSDAKPGCTGHWHWPDCDGQYGHPRGHHVPEEPEAVPFLYQAKAPKKERPVVDGVAHPTVKPLALMRWLVRLVTPPGGTVLEPFAGSGTTVEACLLEGFRCIAIEKGDEYLPLILARIARQSDPLPESAELVRTVDPDAAIVEQIDGQLDIFGEGVA